MKLSAKLRRTLSNSSSSDFLPLYCSITTCVSGNTLIYQRWTTSPQWQIQSITAKPRCIGAKRPKRQSEGEKISILKSIQHSCFRDSPFWLLSFPLIMNANRAPTACLHTMRKNGPLARLLQKMRNVISIIGATSASPSRKEGGKYIASSSSILPLNLCSWLCWVRLAR